MMVSAQKIKTFCQLFFESVNIPICLYLKDQLVFKLPDSQLDFIGNHMKLLHSCDDSINCINAGDAFYAMVRSQGNFCAIMGPVVGLHCNTQMVRSIIKDSSIPPQLEATVADYLSRIPTMPFGRFVKQVTFLNFGLNGDEIDVSDCLGLLNPQNTQKSIAASFSQNAYSAKEDNFSHNSYYFEQELMKNVESGNIDGLRLVISRPEIYNEGIVADNTLRQAKNMFITAITLVTRSAIRGGFDMESSYSLSDVYIRELERLTSVDAVYKLSNSMLFDFTRQVARNKYSKGLSPDVSRCLQYILNNTNQTINVSAVARHARRSRSYISRKFKAELGFNLSSYITRCKLEEARSLLAYTDKPISEISSYLCFSSQSHFQNVFKSQYSLTPGAYRRQSG